MTKLTTRLHNVFDMAYQKLRNGELKTLIPFLGLFRLNGKPMTLKMHYQFAPLFNTTQAANTCVMTGRQVGKSNQMVASTLLRSMLVPFYHTMLVQPRADQIQRLISTVYKPLLGSCPIMDTFISVGEYQKMALREFRNGSLCYAEHLFQSPDRTRGAGNLATVLFDESLSADMKVNSFDEQVQTWVEKPISEIKAGNFLASFDGNAIVISVAVKDASFHGERSCFTITTLSGRVVTGTADHCLPTDGGRKRIGEIIDEIYNKPADDQCAAECGNGEPARGRVYHQERQEHGLCSMESRLQADAVPANEIWPVTRGMSARTREETESRLRGLVGMPLNEGNRTISLCVCDAISRRDQNEDHYTDLFGSDNTSNSTGLVVHGRRESRQGQQFRHDIHQRVHTGRGGATGGVAERQMGCDMLSEEGCTLKHRENLVCDRATTTRLHRIDESDCTICSGVHGIQNASDDDRVCVLRTSDGERAQTVLLNGVCQGIQETGEEAVLRSKQGPRQCQEQGVGGCASGADKGSSSCPLCSHDSGAERGTQCVRKNAQSQEPRTIPCSKTRLQGSTQERSCVQGATSSAVRAPLSTDNAGSGETRKTAGAAKSRTQAAASSCQRAGIHQTIPHGAACQGSTEATGILGAQGTPGEACCNDTGRAQRVPEGVCQRTLSQENRCDDSGAVGRLETEATRDQCASHSQQNGSRPNQGQGECQKTARIMDTGTEGFQGCTEESLGSAEEGGIIGPKAGSFFYDPIVNIEYAGERPVYDIEVVGTHNYILANGICSYNCQDIEYEFLDIVNETMSASLFWGFSMYLGTPKTTDTTLALLWDRSSKAEWVIKCNHCGQYNVPNPENDLLKMIGNNGPICAKCGGLIYPSDGGYVHAEPAKARSFPGYHVSQTIHPLHTMIPAKWHRLLAKVNDYSELALYNEVFGWPYDAAVSPLTLSDLKKAVYEPVLENGTKLTITKPEDVALIADQYRYMTVGVDWSGGGMVSDSYTAYAIIGLRADSDVIDVLYGKRLPKGMSPTEEADEILSWISGVGADAFAYDNGGAGFTRLEIMNHQGLRSIPNLIVVPINYVRPHSGDVMQPHTGQREADLYYYTLDKSRSLAITLMAIKSCRLRFPPFAPEDSKAYQIDFLALREDPRQSLGNETVILITKKPGAPDDFAHAVNFGCSQIWDHFGAYPRIGSRYDASILDYDENHHKIMEDETFGPRGDFERFREALETRAAVVSPDSMLW